MPHNQSLESPMQDFVTAGMRRDPQEQPVNTTILDIIDEAMFVGRELRFLSEHTTHQSPTEVALLRRELEERVLRLYALVGQLSVGVDQTLKKIKNLGTLLTTWCLIAYSYNQKPTRRGGCRRAENTRRTSWQNTT